MVFHEKFWWRLLFHFIVFGQMHIFAVSTGCRIKMRLLLHFVAKCPKMNRHTIFYRCQNFTILCDVRMQNFAQNWASCTELTKRHRNCKKLCRFCSAILLLVRHWWLPEPVQSISV